MSTEKKDRDPFVSMAIRELRSAVGDTQADFAKRIGVTQNSVSRYESTGRPAPSVLLQLSRLAAERGMEAYAGLFRTQAQANWENPTDNPWDEVERAWVYVMLMAHRRYWSHPEAVRDAKRNLISAMSMFETSSPGTPGGDVMEQIEICKKDLALMERKDRFTEMVRQFGQTGKDWRVIHLVWLQLTQPAITNTLPAQVPAPIDDVALDYLEYLVGQLVEPSERRSRGKIIRILTQLDLLLASSEAWTAYRKQVFETFDVPLPESD